jgi:hypothetical protein
MKAVGLAFIRNAIEFDYTAVESICLNENLNYQLVQTCHA